MSDNNIKNVKEVTTLPILSQIADQLAKCKTVRTLEYCRNRERSHEEINQSRRTLPPLQKVIQSNHYSSDKNN